MPGRRIILPAPGKRAYLDPEMARDQREFRRALEEQLTTISDKVPTVGNTDGLYAAEGFFYNAGNVLVAGESDWLDLPSDFLITGAEIVGDPAGTLSVDVYVSSFASWDVWTKISATDPLTLAGTDKNQSSMTGWTREFTGGKYVKFVVTGTPTLVTKATVTLKLALPLGAEASGATPGGAAGGVLAGTYPSPTFAVDMATQAELDAVAATVPSNSAIRAQVEAELAAGSNITITPSGAGASRILTIASTGGAGSVLGYAFSNATSGPTADSASEVQVPDLLTLSFSVAATTRVEIFSSIRASKSTGYIVLAIYDNGVKIGGITGGGSAPPPAGWYLPGQVNGGERQNQQGVAGMIVDLAAGSHQIAIYHAASANLNAITWYERYVKVTRVA